MSDAFAERMVAYVAVPEKRSYAKRLLALRMGLSNPREVRQVERKGIAAENLHHLREGLAVTEAELADLLGTSLKTLKRREAEGKPLGPNLSGHAVRLVRVLDRAAEVLGDEEKARRWLHTPLKALGNESPLSWMDTDTGSHEVLRVLGRIEFGVHS